MWSSGSSHAYPSSLFFCVKKKNETLEFGRAMGLDLLNGAKLHLTVGTEEWNGIKKLR